LLETVVGQLLSYGQVNLKVVASFGHVAFAFSMSPIWLGSDQLYLTSASDPSLGNSFTFRLAYRPEVVGVDSDIRAIGRI